MQNRIAVLTNSSVAGDGVKSSFDNEPTSAAARRTATQPILRRTSPEQHDSDGLSGELLRPASRKNQQSLDNLEDTLSVPVHVFLDTAQFMNPSLRRVSASTPKPSQTVKAAVVDLRGSRVQTNPVFTVETAAPPDTTIEPGYRLASGVEMPVASATRLDLYQDNPVFTEGGDNQESSIRGSLQHSPNGDSSPSSSSNLCWPSSPAKADYIASYQNGENHLDFGGDTASRIFTQKVGITISDSSLPDLPPDWINNDLLDELSSDSGECSSGDERPCDSPSSRGICSPGKHPSRRNYMRRNRLYTRGDA